MTGINCIEAEKHWKDKGVEGFMEAVQFVTIETDEETKKKYISLPTDEEGNSEIKLTIKATEWLIKKLEVGLVILRSDTNGSN